MGHRKKLTIDINEKKNEIVIKDLHGKIDKKFIYNEDIKVIRNWKTQKQASEKAILEYFKRKAEGHIYKPTTPEEYKSRFEVFVKEENKNLSEEEKKYHTTKFIKGSKLIHTRQKRLKEFDYMYIEVIIKVHFDGYYTNAWGKGNNYYNPPNNKGIPKGKISNEIHKATLWALAPYGSNVDFRFISWGYVYHKPPEEERETVVYKPYSKIEKSKIYASQYK